MVVIDRVWPVVLMAAVIAAAVVAVWARQRRRKTQVQLSRLLNSWTETAPDLSLIPQDTTWQLRQALRSLAERVKRLDQSQSEDQQRLSVVVQELPVGVFFVLADGRLNLANAAAEAFFGFSYPAVRGRHHQLSHKHPEVGMLIDACRQGDAPQDRVVELDTPQPRVLRVQTLPLSSGGGENEAATDVLTLCYDISNERQMESLKARLVADVAHELRTPVTSIQGFAETLKAWEVEDVEEARRFAGIVYKETRRLQRLVEDLLDLARIESGGEQVLNTEPLDLSLNLEEWVAEVEMKAGNQDVELSTDVASDLWVEADPVLIRRVFGNLIDNAFKYTPAGGSIHIAAQSEDPSGTQSGAGPAVRVLVSDTGPGIPRRDLDQVFHRFYRVEHDRNRQADESGGTGLGLAIVKHIIQNHGGEVGVESQLGDGASFWFTLPLQT